MLPIITLVEQLLWRLTQVQGFNSIKPVLVPQSPFLKGGGNTSQFSPWRVYPPERCWTSWACWCWPHCHPAGRGHSPQPSTSTT